MPVLALVLTTGTERGQRALAADLARDPRFEVGSPAGMRLPVVVDADTRADERALVEGLEQHPCVEHIEVVFYDFSDVVDAPDVDARDVNARSLGRRRQGTGGSGHGEA